MKGGPKVGSPFAFGEGAMAAIQDVAKQIAEAILSAPRRGQRRVIAIAGPPASGKSTVSEAVAQCLTAQNCVAQVVPMDGFHLDNTILDARGWRARKGAPHTFDAVGFRALAARLAEDRDVVFPVFDRSRDISIAGAGVVQADCDTVIVEGNYLLLDAPVWRDLIPLWDLSIGLQVPLPDLQQRLERRWLEHGLGPDAATLRVTENDLPNVRLVLEHSVQPDLWVGHEDCD